MSPELRSLLIETKRNHTRWCYYARLHYPNSIILDGEKKSALACEFRNLIHIQSICDGCDTERVVGVEHCKEAFASLTRNLQAEQFRVIAIPFDWSYMRAMIMPFPLCDGMVDRVSYLFEDSLLLVSESLAPLARISGERAGTNLALNSLHIDRIFRN